MRQPQLGGVLSNGLPVLTLHNPATHRRFWRVSPLHPWICLTCHPPGDPKIVDEWRSE